MFTFSVDFKTLEELQEFLDGFYERKSSLDTPKTEVKEEKIVTIVSVNDAREALKALSAEKGIPAVVEVLSKFGMKRASEITEDVAADIKAASLTALAQ